MSCKQTQDPISLSEMCDLLETASQMCSDPIQEKLRIFEGLAKQQQEVINRQQEELLEKEEELNKKDLLLKQKEDESSNLKSGDQQQKRTQEPQIIQQPPTIQEPQTTQQLEEQTTSEQLQTIQEQTTSEHSNPQENTSQEPSSPNQNQNNIELDEYDIRNVNNEDEFVAPDVLYNIKTLVDADLQGKLSLPWEEFAQIMYANTCASMEDIAKVGYLIADRRGEVQVRQWDHVLLWFTPIYPNDTLMSSLENAWKFEEMVEIVGQEYFWGFLSANQAAELLSTRSLGSYLIRFSSQPGYYALSLACANQFTMHWRIKCYKDQANQTNLYVDERHYTSFAHLIRTHETEALEIVGSFVRETVCLQTPVQRF